MKTSSSRLQTNKKTKNLSGKGSSSVTQKKKNKRPSPVAATTDIEAILSECQNALKGELSVVTTTTPTTPKLCEEVESSNQNAPDEARLVRSPRKKIRRNASSPKDILHSRVAKYFDKELYFGDIVRRKDDSGWYEVSYDDGDAEEWDFAEAEQGMQLCHKNASNTESNLWEIYHIDAKQLKKEWAATASTKKKGFLLPTAMVQHCPTVAKFFLFLLERQRAWLRRKHHNKEHPELWTNDPVFRNYYFCNVYRQLDRGTAYFRAHVLKLWSDHVKEGAAAAAAAVSRPKWLVQVLWASYCYRLINKIESFQSDPDCTDPNPTTTMGGIPSMDQWPQFRKLVQQAKEENKVVFTNAHQTCGFDRYIEQLDQVHKEPQKLEAVAAKSCQGLEACFRAIRSELPGCGQFMAWQILCDLTEANCLPKELPDADFCVLGNGAEGMDEKETSAACLLRLARAPGFVLTYFTSCFQPAFKKSSSPVSPSRL